MDDIYDMCDLQTPLGLIWAIIGPVLARSGNRNLSVFSNFT